MNMDTAGAVRCPAADPADPTPCEGPPDAVAVTEMSDLGVLDHVRKGEALAACEYHGARVPASMVDGRVDPGPAGSGPCVAVFAWAKTLRACEWLRSDDANGVQERTEAQGEGRLLALGQRLVRTSSRSATPAANTLRSLDDAAASRWATNSERPCHVSIRTTRVEAKRTAARRGDHHIHHRQSAVRTPGPSPA